MSTEVLIIFFLLLLNGFFAMSEIAVVSASKPLLRQMAKQGHAGAERALSLAEDPGRFLSTVQVGITLVGILAGAYGGATIAEKLTPTLNEFPLINPHGATVAVFLIVGLITYFSVVIGELVPKQFALTNAEKLAARVAYPMWILSRVCTPVVWLLEHSALLLFKILGLKSDGASIVTEAEVKAILHEGAVSGAIDKAEHDMLQRVIRLADRDVKSIMTHRTDFVSIDLSDSLDDIRRKVHEAGHSRYPVTDGDGNIVIGIIHAKQLLDGILSHDNINLRDYVREVQAVHDSVSCLQVMEMFKTFDMHLALVVDEYGSTEGIVSASDILEAIIGIMPSNYDDDDQALILMRKDGSWLVDGLTSIDEIHLSIGLEEISSEEDYETIAGFMLHELERLPQEGDTLERYGHHFEVVDMDGRRVDKIIIKRL